MGSAQGRVHGGVLQHGSLVLAHDDDAYRITRSPLPAADYRGLRDLLPHPVTIGSLVQVLTEGFADRLAINPEPGTLTPKEIGRRDELVEVRYANHDWLERR